MSTRLGRIIKEDNLAAAFSLVPTTHVVVLCFHDGFTGLQVIKLPLLTLLAITMVFLH